MVVENMGGNNAQEPNIPLLLPVGKFLEDVGEPAVPLVEGILLDKSLLALAAKPKHLKSFAALDIADAICQDRAVFGSFKVNRPGPVVYLGMEDGANEIASRLLKRGMKAGDTRPFYICVKRIPLGTPAGVVQLEEEIIPIKPVLVIVDTAREALGIRDWGNASELVEVMRPLRDFARKHCTVLLIAHNRKMEGSNGDEISGSNAFTSSIDGWLSCNRKEVQANGDVRLFLSREGRGDLRGDLAIEMNTDTLHFTALSAEQIAEGRAQGQAIQGEAQNNHHNTVLELMVASNDKATAPWIALELSMKERNAQMLLAGMAKAGLIVDSGERTGTTGRTIIYRITDAGKAAIRKGEITPGNENALSYSDYDEEDENDEDNGFDGFDFDREVA